MEYHELRHARPEHKLRFLVRWFDAYDKQNGHESREVQESLEAMAEHFESLGRLLPGGGSGRMPWE